MSMHGDLRPEHGSLQPLVALDPEASGKRSLSHGNCAAG